jgi:hypothetical protein
VVEKKFHDLSHPCHLPKENGKYSPHLAFAGINHQGNNPENYADPILLFFAWAR